MYVPKWFAIERKNAKMIKKVKIICILMLFIFANIKVNANEVPSINPLNLSEEEYNEIKLVAMKESVFALDIYDIVRNPMKKWENEKVPINRRNAFELVYIIHNGGYRFLDSTDFKLKYYSDIEYKTYDDALAKALWYRNLLRGKNATKESAIADFDSNITYYEALNLISRLFDRNRYYMLSSNIIDTYKGEYPYYDFFEDIGLINNDTIIDYSHLFIKKEDLDKPMPAYEFMHLLYQAMYVTQFHGFEYKPTYGYRDITWYLTEYYKVVDESEYLEDSREIYIPFELS